MKRIVLFLLLATFSAVASWAQQTVEITGNGVRLRTSPSLSSSVYCSLNKGKRLSYNYTTSDRNWYCVTYAGRTLYVSRDFASLRGASRSTRTSARTYTMCVVHAKNLRIRTGPSTSYPYLVWNATGQTVHLNHGDALTYLGEQRNGFYKVYFDDRACWIAKQYCTLQ